MRREPLGAEDAAWLHMEEPTNPMVVNGFLELAGPLPVERVRSLMEDAVVKLPRLRARVVEPTLRAGVPHWETDPDLDVAGHVEHVELPASDDDGALRDFVGRAMSSLLDRERPLWRVYAIDRPRAGTALLFRVHHSVADGFALLRLFLSLCDAGGPPEEIVPVLAHGKDARGVADYAMELARITLLPPDPKTLLKGPLGMTKKVAWSEPLALSEVKATAKAAQATVNDVLVATIAGALRRYLSNSGTRVDGLELRAMVPVNLRQRGEPFAAGNHFGLVVLALPIGEAEPLARLAAVKRRMDRLKASPEALVALGLLSAMGRAPRSVESAGVTFFARKASLVLTNVPGPRARLLLAQQPVTRIMFWVPQSGRMGLGISIFSYAGEVTIGVLTDAGIIPQPNELVADLHVEFAALSARARAAATASTGAQPLPRGA